MAPLTQDDVIQILKMVDESDVDELQLTMGDLNLMVRKHADGRSALPRPVKTEGFTGATSEETAFESVVQEPESGTVKSAGERLQVEAALESSAEADGLIPIKAPMLGTFYKSPKPGAPPFVQAGQFVSEHDTVCIIEVMKLFNTVKAGIRGRIKKVCVEDAQMVEFQQTLFLVEQDALDNEPEVKTA